MRRPFLRRLIQAIVILILIFMRFKSGKRWRRSRGFSPLHLC